jgi:glycosyltransferase involved in cell wall biosynthesis
MRVGLVVSGGVDRSGRDIVPAYLWLIERLARRHELHVFALHYGATQDRYPLLGATVHDLGTRRVHPGWRRVVQRARLQRVLRSLPPFDVLHAWWGIPAGWVTTSAIGRPVPVVITASSGEFSGVPDIAYGLQRRWLDRYLLRRTFARAAAVTVPTRHMQQLAERHGIVSTIVPHGVPADHLSSGRPRPGPPWRLIHVAHRNAVKDQATLLTAVADVRARYPGTHLDIVGGDTLDGAIERQAAALGLRDHVTFHGPVSHATVRRLLATAHLHVLSSKHEAAGVAVLDAAAAGVPTVGTAVGYVADWAPAAACAVRPGDPAALARAICALLEDPAMRERLSAAALARAAAFSADDMACAFEDIYHAVATGTRTPGSSMP